MSAIGMSWYTQETWQELAAIPEAKIEMTYPQFVSKVERQIAAMRAKGFAVEKVLVDVGQMVAWCHRHGYAVDSTGRSVFGAVLMTARAEGLDVMTMAFEDRITRSVQ